MRSLSFSTLGSSLSRKQPPILRPVLPRPVLPGFPLNCSQAGRGVRAHHAARPCSRAFRPHWALICVLTLTPQVPGAQGRSHLSCVPSTRLEAYLVLPGPTWSAAEPEPRGVSRAALGGRKCFQAEQLALVASDFLSSGFSSADSTHRRAVPSYSQRRIPHVDS